MDRLIYTAMTGAGAAANRQAILSSNLANVSTNGFRAQLETYRAVPLNGEGSSTRVFAVEASAGFLDLPGQAQQTNRALDAMTTDKSWFAVQGLDGNEAYTRNGSFTLNGVAISYNTGTDSINSIVTRINGAGAGVSAAFDPITDKMTLQNATTGDVGFSVVESAGGLMGALGLTTGANLTRGLNAQYSVNGGPTLPHSRCASRSWHTL